MDAQIEKVRHVVGGDLIAGGYFYCYACDFTTRNVEEAAAHDGIIELRSLADGPQGEENVQR